VATQERHCPFCRSPLREPQPPRTGGAEEFECQRCGRFGLGDSANAELPGRTVSNPKLGFVLSYVVHSMQRQDTRPLVDYDFAKRIDETGQLPSPVEQAEHLLLWLGDRLVGPGERLRLSESLHGAIVGTGGEENFFWLVKHLLATGILEGDQDSAGAVVMLSFNGWNAVEQLRRGRSKRRTAFMAMPYGDAILDEVVKSCFTPALKKTGFHLERLDEEPMAGLIDDRLRVKIRGARFVIADLTHGNQGAYWEAGFAEGLGKPVIYTCERTVFETKKTHFDTNHHLTVPWAQNNLDDAEERLKATIRATLPDQVTLTDE